MCDVTAIVVGSLALKGVATLAKAKGQADDAKAAREAAREARDESLRAIAGRVREERVRSAFLNREGRRHTTATSSIARASAAEAGVAGLSVESLLGDIERQEGEFVESVRINQESLERQAERQARGVIATAESRINAAQGPSALDVGLELGSHALGFATSQIAMSPSPDRTINPNLIYKPAVVDIARPEPLLTPPKFTRVSVP
jgi:hypothetical protein